MNFIPIYSKFIAGRNLKSAINVSKKLKENNIGTIFDYSVESSKHMPMNISEIFKQIKNLDSSFIALKFSSLGIENKRHCESLIDQFYNENNKKKNPNKFLIDAEAFLIQDQINDLSNYAIDKYNSKDKKIFYKTLQMYRNDSLRYFYDDYHFIKDNKYALKLVRGAYISTDSRYKIIFNSKEYTDNNYNNLIKLYFKNLKVYEKNELLIATHNKKSYDLGCKLIDENKSIKNQIYFATLLGMGDNICYDSNNLNKLKYVPYGPFFETTPYLLRRLIENKDLIKYI